MKTVLKSNDLAKSIAVEVAKLVLPKVKEYLIEVNRQSLIKTKKIVREEIKDLVYKAVLKEERTNIDSIDLDEEDDIEEIITPKKKKKISEVVNVSSSNGSAKSKARSIVDSMFVSNRVPSVNELIESTQIPDESQMAVDRTFRPKAELVPSHETSILETDPANIDFSNIIDTLDKRGKL